MWLTRRRREEVGQEEEEEFFPQPVRVVRTSLGDVILFFYGFTTSVACRLEEDGWMGRIVGFGEDRALAEALVELGVPREEAETLEPGLLRAAEERGWTPDPPSRASVWRWKLVTPIVFTILMLAAVGLFFAVWQVVDWLR